MTPTPQRVGVSHSTPQLKGISQHLKGKHDSLRMSLDVQKRVNNGKNPIPIQDNEKLTSPEKKPSALTTRDNEKQESSGTPADMKLV